MMDEIKPWHYLTQDHVDDATQQSRYALCKECPSFINLTKQCSLCGCFMKAKTAIKNATCPDGRW